MKTYHSHHEDREDTETRLVKAQNQIKADSSKSVKLAFKKDYEKVAEKVEYDVLSFLLQASDHCHFFSRPCAILNVTADSGFIEDCISVSLIRIACQSKSVVECWSLRNLASRQCLHHYIID
jgi:hypothetical protein